ncbi:MAG TPA: ATP-binding protein [Actinoplanes sp.]|nr:ATP-binding protein [Actinoplanes sp.]
MSTEFSHLTDEAQTYPIIRFVGVLDADTAGQVRSVLLEGLAQQPEALIVDVCDLSVPDPADALVLRDVAELTADWPAARLVLCAPTDEPGWQRTGLPVWPSRAAALTALGSPVPSRRRSLDLDPVVGAARQSRQLVTEVCGQWNVPELADPACIVVTEMVNNVVAHARTPMTVRLALRGDDLTVAVHDGSSSTPTFTGVAEPTSPGGRGLLLIDAVARRWGNLALDGGKVVWAILRRSAEQPRTASCA